MSRAVAIVPSSSTAILAAATLADTTTERAGALAIKVAFQAVSHGFVGQHTGPARAQNHSHHTSRCGARVQIHQRSMHGFVHILADLFIAEISLTKAATTTGGADFAAPFARQSR